MQKSILFLLLALMTCSGAYAQTTDEQAKDDLDYYNNKRDNSFSDGGGQFWYGTGALLGFSSNTFRSNFVIGLTPMVGYKINNFLSVGPRGSVAYNRFRQDLGRGDEIKEGYITWSAGAFLRGKVYRGFFIHGEYSLVNEVIDFSRISNNPSDFEPIRTTRAIPFLGAGLSQGGGPGAAGYELMVLFRLTGSEFVNESPFEFRTGLNWNF